MTKKIKYIYFWLLSFSILTPIRAQIGAFGFESGDTTYRNYIRKFKIKTVITSKPDFFNTRLKAYQMDGHPYRKYFFNTQGYLIRAVYAANPQDDGRNTYIYSYNKKNQLAQCESLIKGHEKTCKYTYDEQNRLRRAETFDQLLSLLEYSVYEWQNDTTAILKSYQLQPTKADGNKRVIIYNQRGQVIKEQYFKNIKETKIFVWETKTSYRADGQIEKYVHLSGNMPIMENTFLYDAQNQFSSVQTKTTNDQNVSQLYYAPNGLLMRIECTNSSGTSSPQCPKQLLYDYTFWR
jgi:hypothetical protein